VVVGTKICAGTTGGIKDVMQFWILGPMVVRKDGTEIPVTGSVRKALLSRLLMSANRRISADVLIDDVWDGKASVQTLYSTVRDLRKVLQEWGPTGIRQAEGGYILDLTDAELVDVASFEREVTKGREDLNEGRITQAEVALSSALGRWRGTPLVDAGDFSWVTPRRTYLEQKHFEALDLWHEALLGLGRHSEAVATLEAAVADHPLQERLWSHLMVALYRSGRPSDALHAYQRLCADLAELGNVPGPDLIELENRILLHDPDLDLPPPPSARSEHSEHFDHAETRWRLPTGPLTMLMTDVEGSTRLWEEHAEPMKIALRRHDELLRRSIEENAGYVVKTIGDAFHAAFADVSDATTAAMAAQHVLSNEKWPTPITLRVRMAVHTGQCEERDGDYYGPAVNRVARLTDIGHGGQVLVSGTSADLLRDAPEQNLSLRDLGIHRLKDLGRPEHVFQLVAPGLKVDFPPLLSLDNEKVTNNLPAQLTSFVGREAEIVAVERLLDTTRLLTLTGAGGSGKTRLAIEVGARLVENERDSVWLVELGSVADANLVTEAVASALSVREEPSCPLIEVIVKAFNEGNQLLILDNCEHLIEASALLVGRLLGACSNLKVLATSRESLGVRGEGVFSVPTLSLPEEGAVKLDAIAGSEAVDLFVKRAADQLPGFCLEETNARIVASICRRLDGIPLATELVAARVRALSLNEIDARLDRLRFDTVWRKDAPSRQRTLRGAMEWSYDLLSPSEQMVFQRLSVFAGGFDVGAAEAICAGDDVEAADVVDLLGSLVDKSLVQVDPSGTEAHYWLLETIRHYGAQRIADSGQKEARDTRDRHAAWYLAVAEKAGPKLHGEEQDVWLKKLEAAQDNLSNAMVHLTANAQTVSLALRIGVALEWYWRYRSRISVGASLLQSALDTVAIEQDDTVRSGALGAIGRLHSRSGETAKARTCIGEGLLLARNLGDSALLAKLLTSDGHALYQQGEYIQARGALDEALVMARQCSDTWLLGEALEQSAIVRMAFCDDDELSRGRNELEEALTSYETMGGGVRAAWCRNQLGVFETLAGNLARARHHLSLAASQLNDAGDRSTHAYLIALINLNLVFVAVQQDDVRNALSFLYESLTVGSARHVDLFPYQILAAALCATAIEDDERGASLHGAADILLEGLGVSWEPLEAGLREGDLVRLRERLGNDGLDALYRVGTGLSTEEALELAIYS
jgi:predicted ATPase/class 3 adenylate cyclase/DNA-binding SARP family transcriptional activator